MKILTKKTCSVGGCGFRYVKVCTHEAELIWGVHLYVFNRSGITIALSNGLWTDEKGKPLNFNVIDKTLYIRWFSISF